MFGIFLGVALCAAPFFIKSSLPSGTVVTMAQSFYLQLISVVGVMLFGFSVKNIQIKILSIMFLAVGLMSSDPLGIFPQYQLWMTASGLVYLAFLAGNINLQHKKLIYRSLAFICLAESCWVFLNAIGIDPFEVILRILNGSVMAIKTNSYKMVMGSLGNPTHSGALIAATIPFLRPVGWVVPLFALYLLDSSFPVICAAISIITFVCYGIKKPVYLLAPAFALILAAAALFFGFIPKDSFFYGTDRVRAWKSLLEMVGFQITGKGFGFVPVEFSRYFKNPEVFMQMHNEWLELYAIGGLLSVAVAIYLILPVFKNKNAAAINACLISLLVNSLGNFTFHIGPLFMVFGVCYAFQLSDSRGPLWAGTV